MTKFADIYEYIGHQEAQFEQGIDINGWHWSFKDHVKTTFYYKHGRLLSGNDDNTPVKNIIRPLLNLQYRKEDLDVKDVVIYVDDPEDYFMSFLIKKYHDDVFVVENDLDGFIDEIKESKIDYGGGLAKKMAEARPENVDLQSIVFCDQTDMTKGPIGILHHFNPAELLEMRKVGWGDASNGATISIEDLIELGNDTRRDDKNEGVDNKTTGIYIEIYEVHGVLPQSFLDDSDNDMEYTRQMHIVGFYEDQHGMKHEVTLFRKEEKESPFKLHKRDPIFSRALGYGGAEELFENQVWTNNDVIRMQDMLDAASKVILKGVGTEFKSKYPNGLSRLENLSIIELNEGEDIGQIDTTPRSMALFTDSVNVWETHAQQTASVNDVQLGEQPISGTTFRGQERQVIEASGLHEYRKEKFARFIEEIYTDWIIPHIQKQIVNGTKFLSELSTDEMQTVTDALVKKKANELIIEEVFNGRVVTNDQVELFKEQVRQDFTESGNKKFIEILSGEFKKKPLRVKVSVGGNKNLDLITDKTVNIFRQIIANPEGFMQAMQIPEVAQAFNTVLETSGISPIQYAGLSKGNGQPTKEPAGVTPELETVTNRDNE
jgi:hypothetical protein